jgi:hypothetical protein
VEKKSACRLESVPPCRLTPGPPHWADAVPILGDDEFPLTIPVGNNLTTSNQPRGPRTFWDVSALSGYTSVRETGLILTTMVAS